jgi:hypothetical protein
MIDIGEAEPRQVILAVDDLVEFIFAIRFSPDWWSIFLKSKC